MKILNKKITDNYIYFKVIENDRMYFIKKLLKKNSDLMKMMQNEINIYNELKFLSFIPRITKYNVEDDYCIVYEYIDTIELEHKSLILLEIVALLLDVVTKLEKIHEKGIVHCDLKPDNLLIKRNGIYIIDLANARRIGENTLYGTKRYCCVEQLTNKEVTVFFDIYALGVIMYEQITGMKAFLNLNNEDLIREKIKDPLVVFGVPPLTNEILSKATSYEKEKRYKTISEMKEDLQKLLEQCK